MERRCDGSEVLESCLPERKESDAGRRLEETGRQIQEASSGSSWKIPEPETGESEDGRTDGSDNGLAPPAGLSAEQSLCVPKGGALCPEAPRVAPVDPVFLDHPGGEAPLCTQETGSQPPDDRSDAERRASGRSGDENIYSSVLHQLLEQQKHKRGRKHKKKTLMKMAKLLVVAKGWDRRENQSLSLEEKSDLKEEIFTSRRRERAPEKLETSQNLPQLSHLHPVEQKEPGEMRSASVGEETKIPPGSREAAESLSSKSREISVGSGFTQNSKESKPQTDPSAKDPEFSFEEKTGRKRIGNVSPGRKEEMKTDSVTHLQPAPTATEADTGSSSQSGISGSAGKIPAPETESQDSKKLKGRNASVERLLTGGDPLPEQNQSKPEEDKVPSPDVLPKSSYGKPEKAEEETKPPPSVWDQLPSAETSNFQNETGVKDTQTFPDREEMCGTLSPKQHGDPIRSWKKAKGRGRRRKTTQQSSNFQIRTGPICEAPTNQPDTKSADPSVGNPPVKTRKPRKRKHVEADDASRSPKVASPGAAADSQHFLSPLLSVLSEKCGSGKMEDLEPHNSDKPDEGVTCGKIRRSCTLEKKTSSADEEWLIRYLKGSRRKPSKGSNRKTEGNPDANAEQQMLQQTGRGRKKTVGLEGFPTFPAFALDSDRQEVSAEPSTSESCGANVSGGGRADMLQIEGSSELKVDSLQVYSKIVPKKMKKGPKRRRMLSKQTILDPKILESDEKHPEEGDPGATEVGKLPKARRGRKKKVIMIKMEDGASVQVGSSWMNPEGQTGATPEPCGSDTMNLPQIEGTSDNKVDFLQVYSKMAPPKKKRGPKRRRLSSKEPIVDPKILESDEKHPQEGDPGAPEVGKPPKARRGRKKKVFMIKMEEGASVQDGSSWMNPGRTGATPEPSESNTMNLPQIEEMSSLKDNFLDTYSKIAPTKKKRGPKRRRISSKQPILDPTILESDEKHPEEGDPGAPEVGKPPKARRGRKKKILTVKMEEEASCFTEKSQVTSSFQDECNTTGSGAETVTGAEMRGKMNLLQPEGAPADPDVSVQVSSNVWNQNPGNMMNSGGKTAATSETSESNGMNLPQIKEMSGQKDDLREVDFKVAPTKKKRGPKRRRTLSKQPISDPKILESDDAGAPEVEKPPNMRRGRKKKILTVKIEEGAPVQVGSSWMNPKGQTTATPEPCGSNTMNLPQIMGTSDIQVDFLEVYSKMAPTKMKRGPKRRRIWSKKPISDPKILKSDEKHPEEGDPGAPEVGKPPKARRGRKKKVLTVKLEEEASCFTEKSQVTSSFQDESNTTGSGAETVTGAEIGGTMNLLQPEGAPADPDVSVQVSSKVWNQNQIQTLQNDPEEHKIVEYDEDLQHEQDTGAAEDGEISLLPTVKRGRKKNVFKMKMEEGAPVQVGSCWMNPEGQTTATPEPCESDRMSLPQIEGMSGLKDDFLEVDFKTAPTKMKRGPKRRRIWSKKTISDAKILESDEKHPQERAMGTPEVGKPPKARRGRKKKVAIITMEDGASVQDKTSWMEPGSQTEATLETSKTNMMNLPQIEGTSNLKGDFLEVDSKIVPKKMKGGPKRRWISVKQSISEPKIQESDEKHPLQGDRKAPGDGETPEVFVIKTEDKSPVQDKTNWMDPGGQTRVIQEASEFDRMNLPHIERPLDPKDDFPEVYSKIAPTKMKRGPKRRRILSKQSISGPKILESDEKHTNEGVPEAQEAQEDGRTPKVRRGRKKKVLTVQREEGAQVQVGSSWMDPKGQTGWCPEPSVSNTTNLPPIEGLSYLKDYLQVANAKVTIGKKIGPKRRRISSKQSISEPQILETDETHSEEGDPGAPVDGKPASVRRRRRKKVLTVKMEEEAPRLMENSQMMSSFQESETKKPFQESVSAAPRKTIRKRRRRSKTHWTGDKKAKKPRTCPFWDAPAFPGSCDETFNIGQGNLENRMMTNVPSGPEISCRLQERKKEKKYLQCSFCLRSFRHISALTRHRRLHTGRKPYGCSVCSRSFSRLSQLKLHSKVHSEPPAARCPCCEETFRDKKELLNHLRVHLNEVERPRREVGGSRVSRPSADQDKSFRCSVCSKEFTKKSTFEKHRRIHGRKPRSSRKTPSDSREVRGFLVSRLGDAAVVTPVFFKCPICRQVHRHWCHYVLHLQSHTSGRSHGCDECGQDYSLPAGTGRHCSVCCRASGEEKACADSLKDIWEEGGASGRNDQQTTRPDAENEERLSAFPEGRNGKTFVAPPSPGGSSSSAMEDVDLDVPSLNSSFSSVSDPTSKQAPRFHPESPRLSWRSCFGRFPHGTRRGARRHLPQRTLRCRRCELEFHFLGSYMDHLREHDVLLTPRRAPDGLKCSACGKLFSTPRNLRKHQLLHKGSRFHICLPCGRSFSRHSALKAHLEAHRRRLSVPQPAPVEEPFLFPYPCRKCSARFSSTELLEAHQVCHFVAGRKPENPPESILSFIPVIRRVDVSPSGPKRKLPVSDRKDLFRYPDPDRLYVVPDVSSEPPLVVSDEEPDDPPPGEPTEAELELQLLVQSLIPEKRPTSSSDSSSSDSESEPVPQWTNCAICTQTFVDLTALHEHYRKHAGGM